MNVKMSLPTELKALCKYLFQNRWYIAVYTGIFFLIYGAWFFNTNPRVDTEPVINMPFSIYENWLPIGRYGLVLTEYIFGLRWFNPFISTTFGYVILWIAGLLFGYLIWRAMQKTSHFTVAFGLLCFVSPIMVEQLYFDLQIFQIAWAYCLCALGVGLTYYGILNKSLLAKVAALLCMIWSFSSYQIFCILHVAAVVACYILLYRRWTIQNTKYVSAGEYGKLIAWQVGLFIIAMAVNAAITKIFFSGSGYLDNQVVWGNISVKQGIRNIFTHIVKAVLGDGGIYTKFFGVLSFIIIILLLCDAIRANNKPLRWIYFLAGIGLQICPFLLTFYMGVAPVYRSQLVYPFVIACNAMILLGCNWKRRWIQYFGILLVALTFCNQVNSTTRFIYTDEIRTQEDIRLASAIEQRISEVSPQQKNIAFVGTYSNKLNGACIRGELIGMSVFNVNSEVEPRYWTSSNRICTLMETLGFSFTNVDLNQMEEARQKALTMPSWPADGSVADAGDYVIVKLSEDRWPEEIISAACQKVDAPSIDNTVRYAVDSSEVLDNRLVLKGWLFQDGVASDNVMPEVILRHRTTGECIQIPAARTNRADLVNAFENGSLYVNGGYTAVMSIDELNAPLSEYTLILGIRNQETGETHYSDTEYKWPVNIL